MFLITFLQNHIYTNYTCMCARVHLHSLLHSLTAVCVYGCKIKVSIFGFNSLQFSSRQRMQSHVQMEMHAGGLDARGQVDGGREYRDTRLQCTRHNYFMTLQGENIYEFLSDSFALFILLTHFCDVLDVRFLPFAFCRSLGEMQLCSNTMERENIDDRYHSYMHTHVHHPEKGRC